MTKKALSTDPYKGVRDFYPEDQAVQNHIFSVWKAVAQRYGYEEYNASILEPTELYTSKTSTEIVNEQTYTFEDRGKRSVTLRPEMTPTVARLVAGKRRELSFPLRWFSIPNVFRYERPQRGRLREHWQLNADIFGVESTLAEVEIITLAYDIMKAFGAQSGDFEIRVNNRKLLNTLPSGAIPLLDRKTKMSSEEFENEWKKISDTPFSLSVDDETRAVLDELKTHGVTNAVFDPLIVRGFDYYTGIVFEIYDTDPENNRSLFGGGRYDNLLELFGDEKISAVGFGMGDVTMRDFLETHKLLPASTSTTKVMLCSLSPTHAPVAIALAATLREKGIAVAVYFGDKKIGDQIKIADRKHIPYIIAIGDEEKNGTYTLKELTTGTEQKGDSNVIVSALVNIKHV